MEWNTSCSPGKNGELEMRKMGTFNQAQFGKWLWGYGRQEAWE